jgi:hypothetical protein
MFYTQVFVWYEQVGVTCDIQVPSFPGILDAPKSGRGVLDFTYTLALCFTTIVI